MRMHRQAVVALRGDMMKVFAGFFDRAEGGSVYSNEERWAYTGPAFSDPRTTFTAAQRDGPGWSRVQTIRLNEVGRVENFREPYLEQVTLGLEKSIGSGLKLEALYVRRRNKNLVAVVDRNLAQHGLHVTVIEKNSHPGGRCDRLSRGGHHFDTGPTLLIMPHVYEHEFAALGAIQ